VPEQRFNASLSIAAKTYRAVACDGQTPSLASDESTVSYRVGMYMCFSFISFPEELFLSIAYAKFDSCLCRCAANAFNFMMNMACAGVVGISPTVIPANVKTTLQMDTPLPANTAYFVVADDCAQAATPSLRVTEPAYVVKGPVDVTIAKVGGPYSICVSLGGAGGPYVDQTLALTVVGTCLICSAVAEEPIS
jgi:hypothetical protein